MISCINRDKLIWIIEILINDKILNFSRMMFLHYFPIGEKKIFFFIFLFFKKEKFFLFHFLYFFSPWQRIIPFYSPYRRMTISLFLSFFALFLHFWWKNYSLIFNFALLFHFWWEKYFKNMANSIFFLL